jgi:diacylglycerol kinase family enzyme
VRHPDRRRATDLQPERGKSWFEELPNAGRAAWVERASRRKRRERYRLAFIASKLRIGQEPEPFILEIDLTAEPWQLREVAAEVEAAVVAAREVEANAGAAREKAPSTGSKPTSLGARTS